MNTNFNNHITLYKEDFEDINTWYDICEDAGFNRSEAMLNDTIKIVWCQSMLSKEG